MKTRNYDKDLQANNIKVFNKFTPKGWEREKASCCIHSFPDVFIIEVKRPREPRLVWESPESYMAKGVALEWPLKLSWDKLMDRMTV